MERKQNKFQGWHPSHKENEISKTLKKLLNNSLVKTIKLSYKQIKTILITFAIEKGIIYLIKLFLETLMLLEREIFKEQMKDWSNGYRFRKLTFGGYMIELTVPRTRKYNFKPIILTIIKSQMQEIAELVPMLYSKGMTDKDISEVIEFLYGKKYSEARISQLASGLKQKLRQWRSRQLDSYYPIVYIDAIYLTVRDEDGKVRKLPIYIVLAVNKEAKREVLGVYYFPQESATGWDDVFEDLKNRGVKTIKLIVSDALTGIENAIAKHFSSDIQFCTTHLKRNVINKVKIKDKAEVSKDLKEVFRTDDPNDTVEKGWKRWLDFIEKWSKKYPTFKNLKQLRYRYYFSYLAYNYKIRSMIYTTNWIERLNKLIRKAFSARSSMPTIDSAIDLAALVVSEQADYLQYKVSSLFADDENFLWFSD